jgi:hypothetical protein
VLGGDESCVDDAAELSFGSESLDVPWPDECDDEAVEEPEVDVADDGSTHDAGTVEDDLGVDGSAPQGRSCQQGCGAVSVENSPVAPLALLLLLGVCLAISRSRRVG